MENTNTKTATLIKHLERVMTVFHPPSEEEAAQGKITGAIKTSEVLEHWGVWETVMVINREGDDPVPQRVFRVKEGGLPRHINTGDFNDMVPNAQKVYENAGEELALARKGLRAQLAERDDMVSQLEAELATGKDTIKSQRARIDALSDEAGDLKKRVEEGIAREQQAARELSALQAEIEQASSKPTRKA